MNKALAKKKVTTLRIPSGDITKVIVNSQAKAMIESGTTFEDLAVIAKYLNELSTKVKEGLNEMLASGKFKIDETIQVNGFKISKRRTSVLVDFKDTPKISKIRQEVKDTQSGLKVQQFALKQAVAEQVDKGNGTMVEKYSVIVAFPRV